MSYKPPRYLFFYMLFSLFFLTLFYFSSTNINERNLGEYNISKSSDTKLDLNIKNVTKIKINILEIYQTNNDSLCKTDEIYVYGTLRNRINNDIVRIRIQNIKTTNSLNIVSESTSVEPTRNYIHTPIVVLSKNFDCIGEIITVEFEEKINISYLLIKSTNEYKSYKKIKTINIKAY